MAKYFYNGILLKDYCSIHDISYSTILDRINKLKEQNPNLCNDELVNMAIEKCERSAKYFYKGMTLYAYCKKNNISYKTIKSRIDRLKDKNPKLSNKKLTEKAIEECVDKCKYFYNGILLIDYCDTHNINYSTLLYRINSLKNNNLNLSDKDLVVIALDEFKEISKQLNENNKYFYNGVLLTDYCNTNDISYSILIYRINKLKEQNSNLSDDDVVKMAIEEYEGNVKYFYKEIPLYTYCKKNSINYKTIKSRMDRLKDKNPSLSDNELIKIAMEEFEEISKQLDKRNKYFYNDILLIEYCDTHDINYSTLLYRINKLKEQNSNLSDDEVVKIALEEFKEISKQLNKGYKYFYNNILLTDYCKEKNYSYGAILTRIYRKLNKNSDINQIVKEVLSEYENSIYLKKIHEFFEELKYSNINNIRLNKILEFLKIDYNNVIKIIKELKTTLYHTINIIWYFSDSVNSENYKVITDNKLNDLLSYVNYIKYIKKEELKNLEIYDLIGIYKCGLYDSRSEILIKMQKYINHVVISLCSEYQIKLNSELFKDFKEEIILYLFNFLNLNFLPNRKQVTKYMDLTIKGRFRTYLRNYKLHSGVSLNAKKYENDLSSDSMIDYLSDPNDFFELQSPEEIFSYDMLQILKTLSPSDLNFVILRYQEQYSNDELSNYFQISIKEVIEKEKEIINILRNNKNVNKLNRNQKNKNF